MKLLLMNLSHYWKRPALIFWQILKLCIMFPFIMAFQQKSSFWMISMCWMAMLGSVTYAYQMEILSKPFSFALPDHRKVFRRLLFATNAFWSLFWSGMVLLLWHRDLVTRCYASVLALAIGSLAFWYGSCIVSKTHRFYGLIGWIIVLWPMLVDSSTFETYLFWPPVIIVLVVLCAAVSFIAWHKLSRINLFQFYCGTNNAGFFIGFSDKRMQTAQRQVFAVGVGAGAENLLSGVETFFLKRIEHTRHQGIASYVYGAIYRGLGPTMLIILRSGGISFIMMFLMFLIFGYYAKTGNVLIWLPFLLPICGVDIQVHSTLLLTRGRVQRYIAAMSSLLFTTVTTLGIIFVFLGMTRIVEPFMPAIHLRGLNAEFHAGDWRLWYLFAAGVPIGAMLRLLFRKGFIWFYSGVMMILMMGAMLPIINRTGLNMQIPGGWIALTLITAWGTFAAYLYRVCFKKSLATQK